MLASATPCDSTEQTAHNPAHLGLHGPPCSHSTHMRAGWTLRSGGSGYQRKTPKRVWGGDKAKKSQA